MKKLTNVQKVLNALQSGPKTQANLVRETKVKNVYQIISDAVKKGLLTKENGLVKLNGLPVAIDKTTKVSAEQMKAALPKPEPEIIKTLRGEVENIQDGIRSLMMARSYLFRRIEEETRAA
jgi:ribosomal protein S20